ncbi:MAG: hypothetical protein J1F35_06050 [Erysipelotrichales bacterium]|nr:hypothetical protein [Erysipelotrichales bacterium]
MKVIKRDGTIQEFDIKKPIEAFKKPFINGLQREVPEGLLEKFEIELEKFINKQKEEVNIEEIQDFIRDFLIKKNQYEAAENFILYREKRNEYREKNTKLHKNIITKLYAKNIENSNANMDEASFGGRVGSAASEVCKDEALKLMSRKFRKNHENNEIYVHDLDAFCDGRHNCLSYPIDKSLNEGFSTRQTDVREANSILTALQLVAVQFQCQSLEQFGGVAATHIDWSMVPFVRKSFMKHFKDGLEWIGLFNWKKEKIDKYINEIIPGIENKDSENPIRRTLAIEKSKYILKQPWYKLFKKYRLHRAYKYALKKTKRDTYQGVEGLYHNLNTLQSRSGSMLPFSSINYGTCTLPEGQMVTDAILDVTIKGLGEHGVTSIFPCGIFQYKKGVNDKPRTPNYHLFRKALKSTAKRIYPNYANCDWSNQKSWKEYDLKIRTEVLNELNEDDTEKLISKVKQDPEFALDHFRLIYDYYGLHVIEEELPIELFSTMGKRNTTAHVKFREPSLLGVA